VGVYYGKPLRDAWFVEGMLTWEGDNFLVILEIFLANRTILKEGIL
jgi:hypothetical protein